MPAKNMPTEQDFSNFDFMNDKFYDNLTTLVLVYNGFYTYLSKAKFKNRGTLSS